MSLEEYIDRFPGSRRAKTRGSQCCAFGVVLLIVTTVVLYDMRQICLAEVKYLCVLDL